MKKNAGIKTRLCVAILLIFSTVGCGANSVQIVMEQDAVMPDIKLELVEIQSIGESTQNTERAEETGEGQYPIVAEVPSDMYMYTDVGDSDNKSYRSINSMGKPGGGAIVFASEGSYCIYDAASGTYGFLSEYGDIIAPFGYEEAYPFHEGTACVRVDGKFGYIDMNGETVLPFIYDRATPFSEGLAYFAVGDTYGFMDGSGEPLFYLDCESVSSFSEGRAYIYKDGKYGYIDRTGKIVIEPAYDDATYFKNGAAIVRKGGFYGAIGLDGEELMPTVYEESQIIVEENDVSLKAQNADEEQILFNYDIIRRNGDCYEFGIYGEDGSLRYGIADLEGKIVLPPIYKGSSGSHELPLLFGSEHIIILQGDGDSVNDVIVRTAPLYDDDLSEEILVNEITPDSVFYKCANADIVFAERFDGNVSQVDLQSIDAHKTSRRLYGQVSSGTLLYLSVESYDWLLTTDYYAILGEDAAKEETILVYENYDGGGYQSGFWYDEQEQKLVQGRAWHYGGSGNVYGREFFEEQDGSLVVSNSWGYFYDRFEGTKSYTVNDKEAAQEEYEAMRARYRWIENLE